MKITCTSRDDVLKRKAEYEAEKVPRQAEYDKQYNAWYQAKNQVIREVEAAVMQHLSECKINLEVTAKTNFNGGIEVTVESNNRNIHAEDKALSWTWSASLNDAGVINTSSSSWSGLQATTAVQLESLKESVNAIEILIGIDWQTLLNVNVPSYPDYVTMANPRAERGPDFDGELAEITLNEAIGTNTLIKGYRNTAKYYNGDVWYGIISETAAMYNVFEVPARMVEDVSQYSGGKYSTLAEAIDNEFVGFAYRTKKDNFKGYLVTPYETMSY